MQGRRIARGDHLGVANDDRHDWYTGRHCEPERPLLEGAYRPGVESRALRRDDDREALFSEIFRLPKRLDGRFGILPVDEHGVQQLAQSADNGITLKFLLAYAGPVVLDQRGDDHRIEVVAVVEDEHRRPLLSEVLLAQHIQGYAIGSQEKLRKGGGENVDSTTTTAGQQAPADGRVCGRHRRSHAKQGPNLPHQSATAPAGKLQDRPAAFARHLRHFVPGVGRSRVADQIHQRHVLVAVGVEVTVLEFNVVRRGELLNGVGLARTPEDRTHHLAGERAVVVNLEPVSQNVGDS